MSRREDWMLGDDLPFDFDALNSNKKDKKTQKSSKEDTVSERELNPVLKRQSTEIMKDQGTKKSPIQSIEWTTVLVKRAIKMIETGEKTFEGAAIDRFGSIEEFKDAIRQVENYKRTKFNIKIPSDSRPEIKIPTTINNNHNKIKTSEGKDLPLEDVNKLTAKKMKAELAGDYETARKIEEQLVGIRQAPKSKENGKLTLLPTEVYNKRKAEKDMSIAELVRHEKLSNRKEFDCEFERGIIDNKRFREDLDSLDEQVGGKLLNEDKVRKGSSNTFDCRAKSIEEYRKTETIAGECWFCMDSDRFKSERGSDCIIAQGNYTYLTLPKSRSLHPLHCMIVPINHSNSFLDCKEFEEEIWEEVRNFKKCLLQAAAQSNRSYVFIECVPHPSDLRRHTFVDCIPTPRGHAAEELKGYFYKALQETDEEWSQNRKIIDTTGVVGGLRSALPRRHFPYFYVDFRLDQGYAHVIENVEKFGGGDFGRDLMASLLGVSRSQRRGQRSGLDDKKSFVKFFGQFDWTKALHSDPS